MFVIMEDMYGLKLKFFSEVFDFWSKNMLKCDIFTLWDISVAYATFQGHKKENSWNE